MKKKYCAMIMSRLDQLIEITKKNSETLSQILHFVVLKNTEVTLHITQNKAIELIAIACQAAGIQESAFTLKTLQRMELGKANTRAGYSAMVRYSEATFQAWLNIYIAQEVSRLHPDKATRYLENRLEHNV